MTRLEKLLQMLASSPGDAFLLYAIALEYKKLHDFDCALSYLDRVIQSDPNFCYAYYQAGQTLEMMNQNERAKQAYREGIEIARKLGDLKAAGELTEALESIS